MGETKVCRWVETRRIGTDTVDRPAGKKRCPQGLKCLRKDFHYERSPTGVYLLFPDEGRVPHISLVFREIWDTTALFL
jgi:hypothetical protein